MELLILDSSFEEIVRIDVFDSLQWTKRYYDFGQFELSCSINYFKELALAKYIYRSDSKELALIEALDYKVDEDGSSSLKVSGRSIEAMLNERVFEKERTYSGNHESIAYQVISQYFPNLRRANSKGLSYQSTTLKCYGKKVGATLFSFLAEKDLSLKINYDYLQNTLTFEVWKGLDRRDGQDSDEPLILSDNNETLASYSYSRDISNYANYAIVVGDGEDSSPFTEIVDLTNGQARREIFIRGSRSRKREGGGDMNESEYRKALRQEGLEELKKNAMVESLNGSIDNLVATLGIDYKLGDLCSFSQHAIESYGETRVSEVKEIFEDNHLSIEAVLGHDHQSITKRIQNLL